MEMAGIDQVHTKILRVPELVILDVGGDKGIAACEIRVHEFPRAGTAANGDFADRLAAIDIPQTIAAQYGFHMGKEPA